MTDTIPVPREELERIRATLRTVLQHGRLDDSISRTDATCAAIAFLDRILNTKTE